MLQTRRKLKLNGQILEKMVGNGSLGIQPEKEISEMARKTIEQRLAELDVQRATLKARLGKQERANDTRRKVLLGALVLHRLESGKDEEFSRRLRDWLKRELPDFLTRPGDKALFADLIHPAPAPAATTPGSTASAPALGTSGSSGGKLA